MIITLKYLSLDLEWFRQMKFEEVPLSNCSVLPLECITLWLTNRPQKHLRECWPASANNRSAPPFPLPSQCQKYGWGRRITFRFRFRYRFNINLCINLILRFFPAKNVTQAEVSCAQWKDMDLCDTEMTFDCFFGHNLNSSNPRLKPTIDKVKLL